MNRTFLLQFALIDRSIETPQVFHLNPNEEL